MGCVMKNWTKEMGELHFDEVVTHTSKLLIKKMDFDIT
jgi:hypothetical protein